MRIVTVTLNPCIDLELEVEALLVEDVTRVLAARKDPGGKGVNVSRMLLHLGRASTALAALGGATGRELAELARAAGLDLAVARVRGETRINLTISERGAGLTRRLNMAGPLLDGGDLRRLRRALAAASRQADWLVLSGSLPPGAPETLYAEIIEQARRHGAACALDSDGPPLEAGVAARPALLKPNLHELSRLAGQPLPDIAAARQAARALCGGGVSTVLVSLGAGGALLVAAADEAVAVPPPVRAVSTVGCGDALLAAYLHARAEGLPEREALRWGVAAGAASAAKPGTRLASADETRALLPTCAVNDADAA